MENISIQTSADIVGIDELFGCFLERINEEYKEIEINAVTTKRDLEAFIKLIEFMGDEAKITVWGDEMKATILDPSHVAIIDLTLKVDGDIPTEAIGKSFVLSVTEIKNFLRYLDRDDEIIFKTLYSNRIIIKQDNIIYELPLLGMEIADVKIPLFEFKAGFGLPVKKLKKALKTINNISDHIRITATASKVTIEGNNYDIIKHIKAEFRDEIRMWGADKAKSMFPIDYLIDLVDILYSFKVEKLEMSIGNDIPCKISAKVRSVYMHFWLAPRIEE